MTTNEEQADKSGKFPPRESQLSFEENLALVRHLIGGSFYNLLFDQHLFIVLDLKQKHTHIVSELKEAIKQADKRIAETGCPENGWERDPLRQALAKLAELEGA